MWPRIGGATIREGAGERRTKTIDEINTTVDEMIKTKRAQYPLFDK